MGLSVSVYRWDLGDCTNGGESSDVDSFCVVNIPGPFSPGTERPAFELVQGPGGQGHAILRPLQGRSGMVGPMFGGNFGYSSDSRFSEAVREVTGSPGYGAVPIHDRYDTPEDYAALTR
jgi:hypothetical protein